LPRDHEPEGVVGAAIPVDDIVLNTSCCRLGAWASDYAPREIDANKHNTLHVRVVDPEWAGGQYEMELIIFYGDHNDPSRLKIPPFRINVMAE
jgi:hypothetical protein